jgi:Domain of unknown function (DUF3806)
VPSVPGARCQQAGRAAPYPARIPALAKKKPEQATARLRRLLYALTLALCAAIAAYLYLAESDSGFFGGGGSLPAGSEDAFDLSGKRAHRRILPLEASDKHQLQLQRKAIDELARRYVGMPIGGGNPDDLRIIQELVDRGVLKADQTYELQALGVVLGDVIAAQLGFSWVVVQDEVGRSRALRYRDTDTLVFPVTMISKRVEADVRFKVRDLYAKAETIAAQHGALPQ